METPGNPPITYMNKVKAHRTLKQAIADNDLLNFYGNGAADTVVKRTARFGWLQQSEIDAYIAAEDNSLDYLQRMTVYHANWDTDPPQAGH